MPIFTKIDHIDTQLRLNSESLSRLNRVVDYIHSHYSENLDLHQMADIACLSPFHFHRLFNAVLGETPSQFIRRIRLEKTAHKLMLEKHKPITQIAEECGFSSSQNFSRSFKTQFHVNPSLMRKTFNWYTIISTIRQAKNGMTVKDHNVLVFLKQFVRNRNVTFQEMLEEGPPNGIEIESMPSCRVAYVRTVGAAYSYEAVKPAFQQLLEWAVPKGVLVENNFLRGIAWNNPELTPPDKLIYDVCIKVPDDVKSDRWVSVQTLPGGQFAVFRSLAEVRQHVDQNEFMRLLHWLVFSEYRPDGPPYYNIYLNRAEDHPKGLADIKLCIPVIHINKEIGRTSLV